MNPWLFSGAIQNLKGTADQTAWKSSIMPVFAQVALKGKTAVFDQEIYGYQGACAGLGFGNGYYDVLGGEGVEFMSAFFVKGAESSKKQEAY